MIGYYLTGFSCGLFLGAILCVMIRVVSAVREVADEI